MVEGLLVEGLKSDASSLMSVHDGMLQRSGPSKSVIDQRWSYRRLSPGRLTVEVKMDEGSAHRTPPFR